MKAWFPPPDFTPDEIEQGWRLLRWQDRVRYALTFELLLMMLAIVLALLLAGCGGDHPTPPPPPPPPSQLPLTLGPGVSWAVTQGSSPHALTNGVLVFQQCAVQSDGTQPCWDSYVQVDYAIDLTWAHSITLDYEITGNAPVFLHSSPGNTCPGPATLVLLLERSNDSALTIPTYRLFSMPSAIPLGLGKVSYTVSMDAPGWINVQGQSNMGDTLANVARLGFGLGGGCFAAHGVALSEGNAQLAIVGYTVR